MAYTPGNPNDVIWLSLRTR